MCQRVTCSSCGRPSYAGCGRHIEAVLGDVPPEARCNCREKRRTDDEGSGRKKAGLFSALFGGGARRPP